MDSVTNLLAWKGRAAKLRKLKAPGSISQNLSALPLLDFIPTVTPRFLRPSHLVALADAAERAQRGEPVRLLVSIPPRHSKPLHEDTPVTMADGSLRAIKLLKVGDRVVSGHGRIATVLGVYEQGLLPVLRIRTRMGREILAEKTHRFLTEEGWKRAGDLRVYAKGNWQRPRGNYLYAGAQFETEPVELPIEEARFLGYMIGDGNATQRNCRFTNIDPVVRAEFARCVASLGGSVVEYDAQTLGVVSGAAGTPPKRTPAETRAWKAQYERKRRATPGHREPRTIYRRHHLKTLLAQHGADGKTAHQKQVPDAVFRAQPAAVAAFVAAYFECDGTRGQRLADGRVGIQTSFSSVSKILLEGVQHLLARLGIRSSLAPRVGTYKGRPHRSWCLAVHDQARFFDVVPVLGKKGGAHWASRRLQADRLLPDAVVAVEDAGEARCLCITVDKDESFLAHGVVTHNTETVLHAIAWWLLRRPQDAIGYVSYAADIARSKSREARNYAREAGVRLADDSAALHEWRTPEGGGCLATGVGGPLTGHGVNLLIVDDPFKNRQEADSPTIRENVHQWFTSTAMTRVEPGGSVLVVHTRWHEDDLIGRLAKETDAGWQVLNLPAISKDGLPADDGAALWPERWPLEALRARRAEVLPWDWDSLYQGAPKPKQGLIFEEFDESIHVVDDVPHPTAFRRVILSQDFGWTAPGCTLAIGDLGGRFVVLEESYASQRIFIDDRLEQQAGPVHPEVPRPTWVGEDRRIVARWSAHQRSAQVFCDPAEPDKIHDLVRSGVFATGADNDVLHGLRQVQQALHPVDGRPLVTIHRSCANLIRELKAYKRGVGKDGKPTDYPADGQSDHAIDPLRYGLVELMRFWRPPGDPNPNPNQTPPPWQRRGGRAFGY